MKFLLINAITLYKILISPIMRQLLGVKTMCRYSTSCSSYAQEVILREGAFKGTALALKRFMSCQPFTKTYGHI